LALAIREHLDGSTTGETVKGTHPATLLKETVPRELDIDEEEKAILTPLELGPENRAPEAQH
jgi:hypothetical protein